MTSVDEYIDEVYLMSIRPKYASAIFAGKKKYELRKLSGMPPLTEGAIVVVYSSGNVKSIIGEFRVGEVIIDAPERIWAVVSAPGTGIRGDAWQYIRGARRAMALRVVEPRLYPRPITLEEIRRIIPGWMPPFSYKRIGPGDRLYELVLKRVWRSIGSD